MEAPVPSTAGTRRPRRAPRRGAQSPAGTRRPRSAPALPAPGSAQKARGAPTHLYSSCSGPGPSGRKCEDRPALRCREYFRQKPLGAGWAGPAAAEAGRRAWVGPHGTARPEATCTLWGAPGVQRWASLWMFVRQGLALEPRCLLQSPTHRGHPEKLSPLTSNEPIVYLIPIQCWATMERITNISLTLFSSGCSSQLGSAKSGHFILGLRRSMGGNE